VTALPISAAELAELQVPPRFDWPVHPAADLFPLLGDAELQELADDIRTRGLTQPVWLWSDPERGTVLLDGRNRARACQLAGVSVATRIFHGDEVEAVEFAISENVRRRHLTTGQKAAVAYDALPIIEAATAERANRQRAEAALRNERAKSQSVKESCADRHTTGSQNVTSDEQPAKQEKKKADRATDRAASKAGTSGRATARYKRVAEQAPDLAEKVKAGGIALDRAERIIRDREAEQRRIAQAKKEAEMSAVQTTVDIRRGDFRDVLADLEGVDAIITDPPYPHEFIPLLGDLAAWADKVLSPDGVLAVLIGQTYLPEVYRLLDGHRPYRWTGCYLTSGPGYVSHPRKVQSNWKPLIVYGGIKRFSDVVRSEGNDADAKSNHKWGQDYAAFHTIIERLTERGQTVVDPFMGSGTTLLAAHALGRHAIGCDVDADSVETSRRRLG
jgi:ParB-like chromosome segregation protein Spo0J